MTICSFFFFFQAEDGIRDGRVTGVQTCALPICFIAQEVREYMGELGFRTFDEMVGRSERIEMRRAVDHWKARNLDFSRILFKPTVPKHYGRTCAISQDHGLEKTLDSTTLLALAKPA